MEKKELQPELTPNEIKGVDLVVKSLMKKYNFIKGWSPVKDYRKYDNILFIEIKVDYEMVSDYFGIPIKPYSKERIKQKDPDFSLRDIYSLDGLLDRPEDFDGGYQTKKQMNNLAQTIYQQLPPELHRTYMFMQKELPVKLDIHGFIITY